MTTPPPPSPVIRLEDVGEIAVGTVDSPPVNALSQRVRAGIVAALEALAARPRRPKAAVLVCAGGGFFAGADVRRRATKWRCPAGACRPGSRWLRAARIHPLLPRALARFGLLLRARTSVERAFGRLKHSGRLLRFLVRRQERVAQHVELSLTLLLAVALARHRAGR